MNEEDDDLFSKSKFNINDDEELELGESFMRSSMWSDVWCFPWRFVIVQNSFGSEEELLFLTDSFY